MLKLTFVHLYLRDIVTTYMTIDDTHMNNMKWSSGYVTIDCL